MPDPDETQPYEPGSEETSEQTVRFTPAEPPPPPPPTATQPMYTIPPPGGGGQRTALIIVLVLLAGLAAGFAAGHYIGRPAAGVPDENLVLFESASSTFPISGAAFTRSTYDEQKGKCNRELLKQYLRADERRFKAWMDLQGITEDNFDAFVDRLETRILDRATPFTNHGCKAEGDGPCPFAIQSVLAAGTPVWWDPGQQRVVAKCRCSNPLKEPKCPPNCGEQSTPPSATPTPTEAPRTEPPTASPTQPPSTLPPTFPPTEPPITEPPTQPPIFTQQPPA